MGQEAYEVIWEPQLRGKFGADAEQIGMPWFWARIHDRTPQLGYPRGGFQVIYEALAADLERRGGRLETDCAIESIERRDDKLVLDHLAGHRVVRRRPLLAADPPLPAPDQGSAGRLRQPVLADRARTISAHCLILELDRKLQDAYWVSVADPGYPFVALVEHTNWMPAVRLRRQPSGLPRQLPAAGRRAVQHDRRGGARSVPAAPAHG